MKKVEIVAFDAGNETRYAIRRIYRSFPFFIKEVNFFDMRGKVWRSQHAGDYDCFDSDLNKVKSAFVKHGFAEAIPINTKFILTQNEFIKINEMAEKDEGMADLLLKAKEYFILKRK